MNCCINLLTNKQHIYCKLLIFATDSNCRFTWRHNSVLSSLISCIRPSIIDGFSIFADLEGYCAPHGGVIPPHVHVTSLRPDLFLVSESAKVAVIFELICPWDRNIERSHFFKEEKYSPLVADLSRSFKMFHFSVEISMRGQVSKANKSRLKCLAHKF